MMKKLLLMFLLPALALTACEQEEDGGTDNNTPGVEVQPSATLDEVAIVINGDGNGGTITVEPGKPLDVAINQRSSYKDTDGTVFTCEPKATVSVTAAEEKIQAESIKELTAIDTNGKLTTTKSGTNPLLNKLRHEFAVGGQSIVFDMSYEVYTHTNKAGKSIEMPYLKLSQAKAGKPEAKASEAPVTPVVTLRPLPRKSSEPSALSTRGPIIEETTDYEVTVRFNIPLEQVSTRAQAPQTIELEVRYIGAVTTKTELPDPFGTIAYTVAGATRPYIATPTAPLALSIEQTSTYTDSYSQTESHTLAAQITATVGEPAETIVITGHDFTAMPDLTQQEAETAVAELPDGSRRHTFIIGRQAIDITLSQQKAYTADNIEMPYMKLGEPQFRRIVSADIISGDETERTYQIKALFNVDMASENAREPLSETLDLYATYFVHVVVQKPEIVKVLYRPDYQWYEPEGNLRLGYVFFVYRDCYYNDGSVETTTFNPLVPYGPEYVWSDGGGDIEWLNSRGIEYEGILYEGMRGDSFVSSSGCWGFDDLSLFEAKSKGDITKSFEYRKEHFEETYEKYPFIYTETFDCNAPESAFEQSFSSTNLANGWYCCSQENDKPFYDFYYQDVVVGGGGVYTGLVHLALVVDHRVIMFEEWEPEIVFNRTETPYTGDFPKGTDVRIDKKTVDVRFLERDFHGERTDTIYQKIKR